MSTEEQEHWSEQENAFMSASHDEEEEDQYQGVYDDDEANYYDEEEKRPSRYDDDDQDSEPNYISDPMAADAYVDDGEHADDTVQRRRLRGGSEDDADLDHDVDGNGELPKGEIPAFLQRRLQAVVRARERERKSKMLQQALCTVVLLITITWTSYLLFWVPNRILVDTHDFFLDDESAAIIDNGADDYSVAFKGYGDIVFTNKNSYIQMVMTDFDMEARFLCDTPVLSAASTPICESIANETWASPYIPMRTSERSSNIETDDADQRHLYMRVRKLVATDPSIRRIVEASCEQNKNFKVELRGHAKMYHQFSKGFDYPVTNFEPQVLSCPTGTAGDKAGLLGGLFGGK